MDKDNMNKNKENKEESKDDSVCSKMEHTDHSIDKEKGNNEYESVEEYLKEFFDYDYESGTVIKRVTKDFDWERGIFVIKNKKFKHLLSTKTRYQYIDGGNDLSGVIFYFENNEFEELDVSITNNKHIFEKNLITGTVKGIDENDSDYRGFSHRNKLGKIIGFDGCTFNNLILEDKKITKLINTTAIEEITFKNCVILETDFYFKNCPLVQFLEKNSIEKIINVYNIGSEKLKNTNDIYISDETIIGDKNTPDEKQHFFKQLKNFREEKGDNLQAKKEYQKYLKEELKKVNAIPQDKLIIQISQFFGGGIDYIRPVVILIIFFISFSIFIWCTLNEPFNLSLLFPTFPHIFFESVNDSHHLIQGVFFVYYIMMTVCWYFIIKSLHKFTYRK